MRVRYEAPDGKGGGFNLLGRLDEHRKKEAALQWEGTFAQYFDLAVQNPNVAQLSHARVSHMFEQAGVEKTNGIVHVKFFDGTIFGIEKPLEQLCEYFKGAGKRLETRKRILLLMGPPGAGKSTLVTLMKRGLEEFSKRDDGAVYAIKGCPMQEEPLHLVPDELRGEIEKEHGVHIEGDLCPHCRHMVAEKYGGRVEEVPVERIIFSEKNRKGVGTFSPSDPKSQDISELTGSMDLSTIGEYGVESDPRAYKFDGELNVANRGMMEFVEILKSDEKFLYNLLSLSQEQSIKTGRFAMIYADEVIVAHTNENEFNAFIGNKRNEALMDRMIVIRVPYNLKVSDEVRIYEKLLAESNVGQVHVAPHALRVAATFSVLSRLAESKKAGMSLMKKMKLYDGETVEGFNKQDVRELQEEDGARREGMDGISPRYVINRLSNAMIKDGATCVNPIDVLRAMRDGLEQHTSIGRHEKESLLNIISETRRDYDEFAKKEVQRAFVYSYEDSARTLMNNYLDNVEAFCNKAKLRDPITDEEVEPDETLMRAIEEQIGVNETAKKAFREEVLIRVSSLARRNQKFEYTSHERLQEAIEKKLFTDLRDVVKITTSTKTPDAEQLKKINEVVDRLVAEQGYCAHCANELLKYVGTLMSR